MRGFLVRLVGWAFAAYGYSVDDSGGGVVPTATPVDCPTGALQMAGDVVGVLRVATDPAGTLRAAGDVVGVGRVC